MNIYKVNRIRPFKNFNFSRLLKLKTFFSICKFQKIVKNMKKIYDTSTNLVGKKYTNAIIKYMYFEILTGGSTLTELEKAVQFKISEGLVTSAAFCREFLTESAEKVRKSII